MIAVLLHFITVANMVIVQNTTLGVSGDGTVLAASTGLVEVPPWAS